VTDRREADRRNVNAIDLVLVFGLSLVLVALGALMVAAAIWLTTDRDAVSSTLTIMGAGLILIGVVLPRLSGPQSFVPSGVRGPLGELFPLVAEKTLQKAKEQDLPPDRTAAATAIAAHGGGIASRISNLACVGEQWSRPAKPNVVLTTVRGLSLRESVR
jgi:hypothetical protein